MDVRFGRGGVDLGLSHQNRRLAVARAAGSVAGGAVSGGRGKGPLATGRRYGFVPGHDSPPAGAPDYHRWHGGLF